MDWLELLRPDAVFVWRNEEVKRRLHHYYSILKGSRPPKYRAVKRFEVEFNPQDALEELFEVHREASRAFEEFYSSIASGDVSLNNMKIPEESLLDLKITIVKKMMRECHLCEWRCGVDRTQGRRGACGLDSKVRVASAFLHMGEEAPLVPSGTIFFTGCSFKCVYCQNWDISTRPLNGVEVTAQDLAGISTELYLKGARNINYVGGNPDQQAHLIIESLKYMDVDVPLLWNTNMYMSAELLELLYDVVDIWLPDFKYGNNSCARRLSGVPRYFEVASRNHKYVCERGGDIIIRHLVLPNHVECCTKPVLKWISENCPRALVNIMEQYRPEHLVARYPEKWPEIARRPTVDEMQEAYGYADKLGICWRPVS
ncbi:radical SAM protein [Infirmifilum lucidum]|uniref:Radical SAM protein n=1 Tax=Infirmifilum lucidum TaxID=2776706 RepID=A0A7L9FI27_9CREN|nr:radical SAM protein [Infirmifilum lucidum]QOJ79488.1 radical SAM protein [Infirmifilum lucidum]